MVDKSVSSVTNNNKIKHTRSNDLVLLSTERAEKYELFIHLLTNQQQSLVLLGPKGVGKTTFLDRLAIDVANDCYLCIIQCQEGMSFERIRKRLFACLPSQKKSVTQPVLDQLELNIEEYDKDLVLILDDIAKLKPGLVTTLCQLEARCKGLRVVFTLTADELEKIDKTDVAIHGCHFIEIPVLSRWQCAKYLKSLSADPAIESDVRQITHAMADKVFAETKGVPGKIVASIGKQSIDKKRVKDSHVLLISSVLLIALIAYVVVVGLPDVFVDKKKIKSEQVIRLKVDDVETSPLETSNELIIQNRLNSSAAQNNEGVQAIKDRIPIDERIEINANIEEGVSDIIEGASVIVDAPVIPGNVSEQVLVPEVVINSQTTATVESSFEPITQQWIQNQNDDDYTMQLMVLSSLARARVVKEEHESALLPIVIVSFLKDDREKYVLFTGVFANLIEAKRAAKKLPKPFQKFWLRRFGAIKKELQKSVN